jgi:hypothetical protein
MHTAREAWRHIAMRGDQSSSIAQSGTPTKEHTPSGKLCMLRASREVFFSYADGKPLVIYNASP